MQSFATKPKPKRKNTKLLSSSSYTREENLLNDSQESCLPNPQESSLNSQASTSSTFSSCILSQNENDIKISTAEVDGKSKNVCNICFEKPINSILNHGKIGHVYSCYSCAKKLWTKSRKCPVCNVKIKYVTRMIFA